MDAQYAIAMARPQDVSGLAAIERAAARLLDGHAPPAALEEVTSESDLHEAMAAGRLWVALCRDLPVGFALVDMLTPDRAHLEEMDVHPAHGRRGIGSALVRAVCDWTNRQGYLEITLTTFRNVPWNMPFYARLGFTEIPPDEIVPELAALMADETERGLASDRRVAMRYRPGGFAQTRRGTVSAGAGVPARRNRRS